MFNTGERIKQIRKNKNMTIVELASKAGLSHSQISKLENNKNQAQIDTLEKICKVFNISLNEFFNDNNREINIDELIECIKMLPNEDLDILTEVAKRLKK